MRSSRRIRGSMPVLLMVTTVFPLGAIGRLQERDDLGNEDEILPLSTACAGNGARAPTRKSVQWGDKEYAIEPGIELLMSVVRDPGKSSKEHQMALLRLAMLETELAGRPCLESLVDLSDTAGKREKGGILTCFVASGDSRGFPLYIRTLDTEQDAYVRLIAANGLIMWNARRGVLEVISLFGSAEVPNGNLYPSIGDRALRLFRTYNKRKGWGFPENAWWKSIDGRADLDQDQKRALYNVEIDKEIKEIKKWFAANKHRFPDWKPGDPLPENAPIEGEDRDDK